MMRTFINNILLTPFYFWTHDGLRRFIIYVLGFSLLSLLFGMCGKRRAQILAITFCLWCGFAFGIKAVLSLILLHGAAIGIGSFLIKGRSKCSLQTLFYSFGAGWAVIVTLLDLVVHLPVNTLFSYLGFCGGIIFFTRRFLRETLLVIRSKFQDLSALSVKEYFSWTVLLLTLSCMLVNAALPERYFDALATHLVIPSRIANHGFLDLDFRAHVGMVMPAAADFAFSAGHVLGGEIAAKAINFSFFIGLILGLYLLLRNRCSRLSSLLFAASFASAPLAAIESGSLFVENVQAFFMLLAFSALLAEDEYLPLEKKYLLSGLAVAASLQTKMIAGVFIPPLLLMYLWKAYSSQPKDSFGNSLKKIIFYFGLPSALGSIPYAFAFFKTGNPFFPYFNSIFKSPFFDHTRNLTNNMFVGPMKWSLLFDLTFNSSRFIEGGDGCLGLHYAFLLPLALLCFFYFKKWKNWKVSFSLFAGLFYITIVLKQQQYLRYIYSGLPLLIYFIAAVLEDLPSRWQKTTLYSTVVFLCGVNLYLLPMGGWVLREFYTDGLVSSRKWKEFAFSNVPRRAFADIVNPTSDIHSKILIFGQPVGVDFKATPLLVTWYNPDLLTQVRQVKTYEDASRLISNSGASHLILNKNDPFFQEPPWKQWLSTRDSGLLLMAERGEDVLYQIRQTDTKSVEGKSNL